MVGKNQLNLQCCWFIGGAALAICSAVNFSLRSTVDQLYEKLLTVSSPDIRHVSVLSRLDPPQSYLPLQTSLKMKYTLSLISATLLAATAMAQNLKILEDSCAAGAFEAASSSSDRPCQTTDFLCVCTTGKDWYDNYITEYLSNHPGTCTEAQIKSPSKPRSFATRCPASTSRRRRAVPSMRPPPAPLQPARSRTRQSPPTPPRPIRLRTLARRRRRRRMPLRPWTRARRSWDLQASWGWRLQCCRRRWENAPDREQMARWVIGGKQRHGRG
ncbi:hypothetical protein IWX47DRAFT_690389 [Phyllosticta citricarpa]